MSLNLRSTTYKLRAVFSKLALSHFQMGATYSFYREEKKRLRGLTKEKYVKCLPHGISLMNVHSPKITIKTITCSYETFAFSLGKTTAARVAKYSVTVPTLKLKFPGFLIPVQNPTP